MTLKFLKTIHHKTLDARVRTAKLLTLLLLAFLTSVAVPTTLSAQSYYWHQADESPLTFTVPDLSTPKNPVYNICVKFRVIADTTDNNCNGTPACCTTQPSCLNIIKIDNEFYNFRGCQPLDYTFCVCLEPGDHTVYTEWGCMYNTNPNSGILIEVGVDECYSPDDLCDCE